MDNRHLATYNTKIKNKIKNFFKPFLHLKSAPVNPPVANFSGAFAIS